MNTPRTILLQMQAQRAAWARSARFNAEYMEICDRPNARHAYAQFRAQALRAQKNAADFQAMIEREMA